MYKRQLVGPIQTPAGRHLIEVTARTVTEFESVRTELTQAVKDADASPAERFELRQALLDGHTVRTY